MKKLMNLVVALAASLAGLFLPLASSNIAIAEPGHTAVITISSGIEYTVQGRVTFDGNDKDVNNDPLVSGGTFNYAPTGGNHVIGFGIDFVFGTMFGYTLDTVTLNGSPVEFEDGTDPDSYVITVPELASYDIGITLSGSSSAGHVGTIIWGNPGVKDLDDEDALIVNGYAEILAVYDADGHLLDERDYIPPDAQGSLVNGFGHVVIPTGSKVVFKFTPYYGYQLVSVKANEVALQPQDNTNEYTFTMRDGNVHFAATFAKTSDAVAINSEKVAGGSVSLAAGAIENGTARISVNDVDLSSSKVADFTKAANGYTISDYIDIDFYNIFYKGKADSTDVWSNQLHELGNEATITLKLADDVDVSNVVLVHNIDDGDEYEIIEIDSYDQAAHTVTFRTKSFSNFAIATKPSLGSPDSGFSTAESVSAVAIISTTAMVSTVISGGAWLIARRYLNH